jgi:hypothetical protein
VLYLAVIYFDSPENLVKYQRNGIQEQELF